MPQGVCAPEVPMLPRLEQVLILPCSAQSLGSLQLLLQRKLCPSGIHLLAVVTHSCSGREHL